MKTSTSSKYKNNNSLCLCGGKLHKHGFTLKGNQRFKCSSCLKTCSPESTGSTLTDEEKKIALAVHKEGLSIRGTARVVGRGTTTIWSFLKKTENPATIS